MALQLTRRTRSNVELVDAYHKILEIRRWRARPGGATVRVHFRVGTYPSKTDADEGNPPVESQVYSIDYDKTGDNFHTQAYSYLKTLAAFGRAADV